jgi:hypothetical protein
MGAIERAESTPSIVANRLVSTLDTTLSNMFWGLDRARDASDNG